VNTKNPVDIKAHALLASLKINFVH